MTQKLNFQQAEALRKYSYFLWMEIEMSFDEFMENKKINHIFCHNFRNLNT